MDLRPLKGHSGTSNLFVLIYNYAARKLITTSLINAMYVVSHALKVDGAQVRLRFR